MFLGPCPDKNCVSTICIQHKNSKFYLLLTKVSGTKLSIGSKTGNCLKSIRGRNAEKTLEVEAEPMESSWALIYNSANPHYGKYCPTKCNNIKHRPPRRMTPVLAPPETHSIMKEKQISRILVHYSHNERSLVHWLSSYVKDASPYTTSFNPKDYYKR